DAGAPARPRGRCRDVARPAGRSLAMGATGGRRAHAARQHRGDGRGRPGPLPGPAGAVRRVHGRHGCDGGGAASPRKGARPGAARNQRAAGGRGDAPGARRRHPDVRAGPRGGDHRTECGHGLPSRPRQGPRAGRALPGVRAARRRGAVDPPEPGRDRPARRAPAPAFAAGSGAGAVRRGRPADAPGTLAGDRIAVAGRPAGAAAPVRAHADHGAAAGGERRTAGLAGAAV
ncbi:MAG: Beta-ketoadipate enol-lactone hydrolase, partial [uncultured Ramlibacter sp.]